MDKILYPSQIKYLEKLRRDPSKIIKEMEEFAAEKKVPILDWNSAELLEQMILIQRPKAVLEIGTAIAYSAIRIASKLRKKGIVDTIEMSEDNIELAREFIEKAGLEEKINLIFGDALEVLPKLNKKYDFIFLDADKEDYEKLFYFSLMLLKKGGMIFIDNLLWHSYAAKQNVPANYKESTKHIREFNKLFSTQYALETTIVPVGDGIGLGVKIK